MIGKSGERGSGISVLPAQHDDDDDDIAYLFAVNPCHIYIFSSLFFLSLWMC